VQQNFRLQFYTSSGSLKEEQPWGDIQAVNYELRPPTNGASNLSGQELIRSVTRNLLASGTQETEDQFLMGNVQSLEIACFDGNDWRDSWDSTLGDTNLPTAVRVRIQLANTDNTGGLSRNEPFEIVVPLVCQARTNSLSSTNSSASGGGQ
jgi:type II secretion system (T2SS) protein J